MISEDIPTSDSPSNTSALKTGPERQTPDPTKDPAAVTAQIKQELLEIVHKVSDESKVTKSLLTRLVKQAIGPAGRVWVRKDTVEIGFQLHDRPFVVAIGGDLVAAWRALAIAAHDDTEQERKATEAAKASELVPTGI